MANMNKRIVPGPPQLDIIFCNPTHEYYAGEALCAIALVKLEKPMPITAIQVKLTGKGTFKWYFSKTHYTTKERYLDATININISSDSASTGVGTHRFPFAIDLPRNLPESYADSCGGLRYKAIVTVKSATYITFLNKTCSTKKHFFVHASIPVPTSLNTPTVVDESDPLPCLSSCCLCWSYGEVSAKITTDKGGYLPGETIVFKAEIANNSSKDLRNVTLVLKRNITHIFKPDRWDEAKNCRTIDAAAALTFQQGLNAHEAVTWSALYKIPLKTPPTSMMTTTILNIKYYLQLEVGKYSGCCAPKVLFKFPLIIGSVQPRSTDATILVVNCVRISPASITE